MASNFNNAFQKISNIKLFESNYSIAPFHGTEAEWENHSSYIPKAGEIIIYDIDNNYSYERMKIGDGVSTVDALPFIIEVFTKDDALDMLIETNTIDPIANENGTLLVDENNNILIF